MAELGYVEGKNYASDLRLNPESLTQAASDLVRLNVNVVFAAGPAALAAASKATTSIPVVGIDLESDPVAKGYVKSLGRPGGNITGMFLDIPELSGKQVQLLKQIVPQLSRMAILGAPGINALQFKASETAARAFNIETEIAEIQVPDDFAGAMDAARARHVEAGILLSSPLLYRFSRQIGELALAKQLPLISSFDVFPKNGGLLAYGPNVSEMFRRCGSYVGKILQGAKPSDLPIQRPEKFDLVINLNTAAALGVTVPPLLLVGSLINFYQTDKESPYHALEPASRHPYDFYARMIVETVGKRRIDALDGRDLKRWWNEWSAPLKQGSKPRLAAARMAMIVLKTALAFGISCRKPGCAELKQIISEARFIKGPRPRTEAATAAEIVAARAAAHELGHPEAAFAYVLQFEGLMRQWDVIGKWVPLSDKRPSSIIDGAKKWLGPMWSQVDHNLILRFTASKTQFTTAAKGTVDFRECPMVMGELDKQLGGVRTGPLIINPKTGLPYTQRRFAEVWRMVANRAGIASAVWNRDLRAAAVTEARQGAAPSDDVAKVAANSRRMVAKVYDRDQLEAHRRVMRARVARRGVENGE